MAIKTYKYRIYPTEFQRRVLNTQLAICCELYNAALQERRDAWNLKRKSISFFDQTLQLRQIRDAREDVELINANVLENVLKRVDFAFKGFFRRVKVHQKAGYPRFHSVQRYDSLTFRQIGNAINGSRLRLSKIGNIRIKFHRPVERTVKTLTVKREARRWYALFACEVESKPLPFNPNMIGVDVGLSHFATLNDGTAISNPRWHRTGQAKLRRTQRRIARRKKGSNRRRKAILVLQRAHVAIRNQRADFHHKLSRKLVNENGLIAIEDLNVKGLAGGILAKSVNDAGWSNFINMLSYKAESAGRLLIKVDPRGTSQTCICGVSVPKTLSQRRHECSECGLSADRDHVSAQVILQRAVSLSGANVEVFDSCVA